MNDSQAASGSAQEVLRMFNCQDFDGVIRAVSQISETAPTSPALLNLEAASHLELGKPEEALFAANRAIELQPNIASSHFNRASALARLERWPEAAQSYREVLALKPAHEKAHRQLGILYYNNDCFEDAVRHFLTAPGPRNRAWLFKSLWMAGMVDEFFRGLQILSSEDVSNRRLAAISSFASEQMNVRDPHPFCPDPFSFIHYGHIANHVEDPRLFLREINALTNSLQSKWEMNKLTKGGEVSTGNIFSESAPIILELEQMICAEIARFRAIHSDSPCLFIKNWPKEGFLKGWTVRLRKNGHHLFHNHADGWISGVIYLKVAQSEGSDGAIEFSNTDGHFRQIKEDLLSHIVMPEVGDILLFPSSIYHRTIPLRETDDRRVIAFDLRSAD